MFKRPRLDATARTSRVPLNLSPQGLRDWLYQEEKSQRHVIDGAEARIVFHNSAEPDSTEFVFLNIHGFSACRQEIAPVAEDLAAQLQANLIELRLAGHGLRKDTMQAAAEDWIQSVTDGFDLAHQLGQKTILVGTSTGAPLACWADRVLGPIYRRPFAHLFIAPNFKVNNPFAFILTLPFAEYFVPWVLGKTRSWTPEDEPTARFWTTHYDIQAVIEMQKVVDWFRRQSPTSWTTPMAMMVMDRDPTISAKAAKQVFKHWRSKHKMHPAIEEQPDERSHVFTGAIAGPHRTQATVKCLSDFLKALIKR
ncbi:MAG: hypothetical protein HN856_04660 [Gammaproteobacteria bacterium]|nr:hypothetical protein [Gammaproteobacteria bacterium]